MKAKRLLVFLLVLVCATATAQNRWTDIVPQVNIEDEKLQNILYSFEKKSKKLGLILEESPNFIEVLMHKNQDGCTSVEIVVEDGNMVCLYRGGVRLYPIKACHLHDDCLFLFSGYVDSIYLTYTGDSMNLCYSDLQGLPIFMIDTNECPELSRVLLEYQSTGEDVSEPLKDTIITTLKNVATRRIMKEWWCISGRRKHRCHQYINIPGKADLLVYQDDSLTVYSVKPAKKFR